MESFDDVQVLEVIPGSSTTAKKECRSKHPIGMSRNGLLKMPYSSDSAAENVEICRGEVWKFDDSFKEEGTWLMCIFSKFLTDMLFH